MLLARRDSISHDLIKIHSAMIHRNLKQNRAFRSADRIGIYYPGGSEVMTQDIIQDVLSCGKEACLPRITGDGMDFRRIQSFDDLEPGSFDLLEPKDRCVVSGIMQAIIIPAVGASENGYRIGYGGGFYDRYLEGSNAVKIALCFQGQMIGTVPHDAHDVCMDYIITEEHTYRPH